MRAKPLSPHIWFASRKGRRGAPRWSRVGLGRLPGACPGQARVRRARGGVRPGGVVSDGSRGVAPTPGSASSNDEGKPRHKRAAGGRAVLTARQRRDSRRSGLFGVRAPRRMLSPRRTDPRTQHAETLSRGNSWAEPRKMTRVAQALARAGARAAPIAPQAAGVRLQQHVMCTANQLRTCRRQRQGRCRKCPFKIRTVGTALEKFPALVQNAHKRVQNSQTQQALVQHMRTPASSTVRHTVQKNVGTSDRCTFCRTVEDEAQQSRCRPVRLQARPP